MRDVKWAVLGTGVIANEMAVALGQSGRKIYAVGNRTHRKAVDFASKYGIEKAYDDFNEMFIDANVDAIYITTPHNTHIEFIKQALRNGKHVLVEKSITLNSKELEEAVSIAQENHLVLCEAMTIYHMPIYRKLREILDSGKLGKVNIITMNFGSFKEYALSFIRWFMESKPNQLLSQVKMAPTGVDEQAALLLTNKEGQMATVALSLHSKQPKWGMVSCEQGFIEIMEYPRACEAKITYTGDGSTEIIKSGQTSDALKYELDDMEAAVNGERGQI